MIELLYGPIASGKSTYARKEAALGFGAIVANDDAIVTAVHGGNYDKYRREFKALYKGVTDSIIMFAVNKGVKVIVDSTSFRRSTRDFYRMLGKRLDVSVGITVFRGGEFLGREDGSRRWAADPRGMTRTEWEQVGEHHASLHQPLELEEDFDQRRYVPWEYFDEEDGTS